MSARTVIEQLLQEEPQVDLVGKVAMAKGKPVREQPLETMTENIVIIRQQEDGYVRAGWTLVYFMDSPQSARQMREGKLPYLMVPRANFISGRNNPITDVWKKQGHEHILGLLQGHSDEKRVFVDMMTVRTQWRRNHITTLMIDALRREYPKAKLEFSTPTDQGEKFISKYAPAAERPSNFTNPRPSRIR